MKLKKENRSNLKSKNELKIKKGGSTENLMNRIMELEFTSKPLQEKPRKCEKQEKLEKLKVKSTTEKGNMGNIHIYAENTIRKHTEQMNYLHPSLYLDDVGGGGALEKE